MDPRRLPKHVLRGPPNRRAVVDDPIGPLPNRDHRRLVENDAFSADADEGVASTQVDAHINAEPTKNGIKEHV